MLVKVTTMRSLFYGATEFNQPLNNWVISNVTNMRTVFYGATEFNQPLNNWNTSKVETMDSMFGLSNYNQPLNTWDVSSVKNMSSMFRDTGAFNQDISNWDVSNVTDMSIMFYNAKAFNQDISGWDVSSVTNMSNMFRETGEFNQDISNWNVSNVTDMSVMFYFAPAFNQDLSLWDVSSITNMTDVFSSSGLSTENYDAILNGWSTQSLQTEVLFGANELTYCNAQSARNLLTKPVSEGGKGWTINDAGRASWDLCSSLYIFSNRASLRAAVEEWVTDQPQALNSYGPINTWDVSQVSDMSLLFFSDTDTALNNFNEDISGWDVSNVTNMYGMFASTVFNQDISGWDVSSVLNTSYMFFYANTFNQDISNWNVSNVTDMGVMFYFAPAFNQDLSLWDVSSVTNMSDVFSSCGLSTENYDAILNGWSTQSLQTEVLFGANELTYCNAQSARNLLTKPVSEGGKGWTITDAGRASWDLCNYIFTNRASLTTAVEQWVTDQTQALNSYGPINTWDVSQITDMSLLFYSDTNTAFNNFNEDISGWDVSNVTNMYGMFANTVFNQGIFQDGMLAQSQI